MILRLYNSQRLTKQKEHTKQLPFLQPVPEIEFHLGTNREERVGRCRIVVVVELRLIFFRLRQKTPLSLDVFNESLFFRVDIKYPNW